MGRRVTNMVTKSRLTRGVLDRDRGAAGVKLFKPSSPLSGPQGQVAAHGLASVHGQSKDSAHLSALCSCLFSLVVCSCKSFELQKHIKIVVLWASQPEFKVVKVSDPPENHPPAYRL